MKKVITTVGASLFENYQKENRGISASLKALKDRNENDLAAEHYEECEVFTEDIGKRVRSWLQNNDLASAEITSTLKIKEELAEDLEVYLLASDTVVSVLAAELVAEALEERGFNVKFSRQNNWSVIKGLQVKDGLKFRNEGMKNLISSLEKITEGYYGNVVFNITGGYKATLPYLTILAQVNSVPLYYIFEDAKTLLYIPPAPVDVNWGLMEKYFKLLSYVEKGVGKPLRVLREEFKIPFEESLYLNLFLEEISEGEEYLTTLSPIGEFFWKRLKSFEEIFILEGSGYRKEEISNKKHLEKALLNLSQDISQHCPSKRQFDDLKDEIIKHAKVKDNYWIYKNQSPRQVRILYHLHWLNEKEYEIWILNYRFITSDADDHQYKNDFELFVKRHQDKLADKQYYVRLPLKKEVLA